MNIGFRMKPGRKRKIQDDDKCMVCGGKSIGLNFGVHTCSPCKAFFRRNAVKLGTYEFQCRSNGDCPVTSNTRRQCNCCRLAKCFRVGMDRKAIRTEDQRLERSRLIEANRQKRAEKTNDEQKALVPCKNELIRPTNLFYHSQTSSSILSAEDYTTLTNIFQAYEKTCVSYTYKEYLSTPVNERSTLDTFLNASANMYMGLINYFKCISEFDNLSINVKLSLIKRNLNQIFRIHSTYIMKNITPDLEKHSSTFLHLFPEDLFIDIRDTSIVLSPFVHDPILVKLFMIVLMLSTHMNIHHESNQLDIDDEYSIRNVFYTQNIYLELLWRYIVSRSSDYSQAVHLFTLFITRTLYSQIVQVKINRFIYKNLPSQRQSLEPIIQSIWTSDKINSC